MTWRSITIAEPGIHTSVFPYIQQKQAPSTLAFSCQRIFCWRKEDENRQIRSDAIKVVTGASRYKDDGPFLHGTGLITNLDNSLTADNIIDLILSVGLLRVNGARGQSIEANTERWMAQKLCITNTGALRHAKQLGKLERMHI